MNTRTLTTTLPTDTLYVSGTVNGVATTWTNTSGQTWETVAERSPTDVYVVALTIINTLGAASETSFTLYYGLHLITDRTHSDVWRVTELRDKGYANMTEAERAEWDGEMKGRYDITDFNRVEAAVAYLAEMLQQLPPELVAYAAENGVAWDEFFSYPYDPADYANIETKTMWTRNEWPDPANRTRYLNNVRLLREAIEYATSDIPDTMEKFTPEMANALERALEGLHDALTTLDANKRQLIENTAAAWHYSGEIYTGEVTHA